MTLEYEFAPGDLESATEIDGRPVFYVRSARGFGVMAALLLSGLFDCVYLDTETTGLDPFQAKPTVLQAGFAGQVWIVDLPAVMAQDADLVRKTLAAVLADPGICKVFHNAKFDLKMLLLHLWGRQGHFPLDTSRPWCANVFDTYLAELVLTAGLSRKGQHSLKYLAKKYLDRDMEKGAVRLSFDGSTLSPEQIEYAARDVIDLEGVKAAQVPLLLEHGLVRTARLEFDVVQAVAERELAGAELNKQALQDLRNDLVGRVQVLEKKLREICGREDVNFRSPNQVLKVLGRIGHPVLSTAEEVLEGIDHPFARAMLEYRDANTQLSRYADGLPKHVHPRTGRIHPTYWQHGTATGRGSCSDPNLQQIPKEQLWRSLFTAPPGHLVITADYSQIELRILAQFSQDPALMDAYRQGQDIHAKTASVVFDIPLDQVTKEQRQSSKAVNFGLIYGMTAHGLALRLGIREDGAQAFINRYFEALPGVKKCLDALAMDAVKNRFSMTLSGRKRFYRPARSTGELGSLQRQGKNTPIQGSCGDILKLAEAECSRVLHEMGNPGWISNQVHDELVFMAVADRAREIAEVMVEVMVWAGKVFLPDIPVSVDHKIAPTWVK